MLIPFIFDLGFFISHMLTRFLPHWNDQAATLATTVHKDYYEKNVMNAELKPEEFYTPGWNMWTIWTSIDLFISCLSVANWIYMAVTMILDIQKDTDGRYQIATVNARQWWNYSIFYVVNTWVGITSFYKWLFSILSLEYFGSFDADTLAAWDEYFMYVWGADERLELQITGWAELLKLGLIIGSYLYFSQAPDITRSVVRSLGYL
jgi:hypothetical protein